MRLLVALFAALFATTALAASVSGRITSAGVGVAGMEVRLWARTPKGYSFQPPDGRLVTTDATGAFTITNVSAGTYKLDTRMGPTLGANLGDRWLDVMPPSGNGYVAEYADELVIAASDTLTGLDIAVEVNGGLEGRTVSMAATPVGGLFARLEGTSDGRVHHNDSAKTTPASRLGELSFRGMPAGSYRLLVHDPNSVYADVTGPVHSITAGSNATAMDLTVPLAPADGFEPNNSFATGTVVDPSPLRQRPSQPLAGSGLIAPRNSGDVDFYCWTALAGERYRVFAVGTFGTLADGGVRESPWVDPVVSFWHSGSKVAEDDDSGPLAFDARLDTGVVAAGPVCVAVTTFGDSMWQGLNQGSAGTYAVRVEMANLPPMLALSYRGMPTPTPPSAIQLTEGSPVSVAVTFADPEGDAVTATWALTNAQGQTVASGSFPGASGMGTVSWTASNTAARGSPYVLTVRVSDGQLDSTSTARIEISSLNWPPRTPVQLSPDAGSTVRTSRPPLVCREASDDDADPLRYEFEILWADGGLLLQAATVAGNDAGIDPDGGVYGLITFVPQSLPENARLEWRVRAFDGTLLNGYSGWTDAWRFTVDTVNDPPAPPVLLKPTNGEELMVRRPTLEVQHPTDPEGDPLSFIFEIARDMGFSQLVAQSQPEPATNGSATTSWTTLSDLDWSQSYWARAIAVDGRGARSQPSAAHRFTLRGNSPPMTAQLKEPFSSGLCTDQVFSTAPMSLVIGPTNDVEQDVVLVEVQVSTEADSTFSMPLFRSEVRANAAVDTTIGFDGVTFQEDQRYVVRARTKDGQNTTEWVSCSFRVDAVRGNPDGGTGISVRKPCGCGAAESGLLVALAVLAARRRRR